jgi:hypothetical protein
VLAAQLLTAPAAWAADIAAGRHALLLAADTTTVTDLNVRAAPTALPTARSAPTAYPCATAPPPASATTSPPDRTTAR